MELNTENIPEPLKLWPNWVCWKLETRDGKATKVPVNARTGDNAKSNDSTTWSDFETTCQFYQDHGNNGIQGIGFELGAPKSTPYVGIDLDDCRDPETGIIEHWAQGIIDKISSYTEISPSGTGIRIWTIAVLPEHGRKKGNIELYDGARYLTTTGNHLPGTPLTIEARHDEILEFHQAVFGEKTEKREPPTSSTSCSIEDDELLKLAFNASNGPKFKQLWSGEWQGAGYSSQSEADQALCNMLAFWTGNDATRIGSMFRQSGLMREKWNKRHHSDGNTYGEETIRKAIDATTEVYKPKAEPKEPAHNFTPTGTDGLAFPDIMTGAAGKYADLYSSYLETPKPFLFMAFLTVLGNVLSGKLTLKTELQPQPRLFVLLLGDSAEPRKSTSIIKTIDFFNDAMVQGDFNSCLGVGSAEGLEKRIREIPEPRRLVLCFDEFKTFVSKAKIEKSVLLPCVNTLFESNFYHNATKQSVVSLEKIHLSLLAASTVSTYERIWDSSFTDIGFNNRLFLVPGTGGRKFAIPEKIPEYPKSEIRILIRDILRRVEAIPELDLTEGARELYENWYLNLQRSIHANRLDSYALRFLPLLAVNEGKQIIDVDIVSKTTALMDWQLAVRKQHDPIDADNATAKAEEKIRRVLLPGPRSERELQQRTHAQRMGLWVWKSALKNLCENGEVCFDKKSKLYGIENHG